MDIIPNSGNSPNTWFSVELSDRIIKAFAPPHMHIPECEGVVILDGLVLRYGKILKPIYAPSNETDNYAFRIVSFDENGMLDDYLSAQKQLAMILIPKLIKKHDIQTELLDVETVSYQSRALLRIKVSNAKAKNIETLTKNIIDLFYIAVEIYSN